jgi:hypothetical protein
MGGGVVVVVVVLSDCDEELDDVDVVVLVLVEDDVEELELEVWSDTVSRAVAGLLTRTSVLEPKVVTSKTFTPTRYVPA